MPDKTERTARLPLTEARRANAHGVTEADIRALVDAFYAGVREDDLLGPVFERHVKDWSVHLPKMYAFWGTVILHTGRYSGRPLEVHQAIPELSPPLFERWLALWERTVAARFDPVTAEQFVIAARRMAASMMARLSA